MIAGVCHDENVVSRGSAICTEGRVCTVGGIFHDMRGTCMFITPDRQYTSYVLLRLLDMARRWRLMLIEHVRLGVAIGITDPCLTTTPLQYGTEQDMLGNIATSPGILFLALLQSFEVKQYVWSFCRVGVQR